MDLDLKEIGITFIVGTFTILGLEAVFYYFFGLQITGFFKHKMKIGRRKPIPNNKNRTLTTTGEQEDETPEKEEHRIETMKIAVFIGVAFAIGLLAEDLSYKYVDSVPTPFKDFAAILSGFVSPQVDKELSLPSKESSRVKTLVGNIYNSPDVSKLAVQLAKRGAFDLVDEKKVSAWISQESDKRCQPELQSSRADCPSIPEIESAIFSVYYQSKNTAYLNANYYDEMRRIETRRDFSRSISLIAFLYFLVAVVFGAVRIIYILFKYDKRKSETHKFPEIYKRIIPICTGLFVIYFLFMWAYQRESEEFNKRAFGYFSTILSTSKQEKSSN